MTKLGNRHSRAKKAGTAMMVLLSLPPAFASPSGQEAGDTYELTHSYRTTSQASDKSSGSSNGSTSIFERVIAIRDSGVELEYDLPPDATADDRAREWQFPARVLRGSTGRTVLLNRAELEARLEIWLAKAELSKDDCGRVIFTWNAFRIECDPQTVLKIIDALDLSSTDLREGALYRETGVREAGRLTHTPSNDFRVVLEIDPEAVRRTRAESDVIVGNLMRKPVTLETALKARADEQITGTVTVTFEADGGNVRRRTSVTQIETKRADGWSQRETDERTIERRPVRATPAEK
ncbi:hypothetical protein [Sphingomonas sp. LT1P40]|uniref:hypothetical protein n=1 Tax=Alteristakelama amylovorans TaxID=3096166 RepID=UPI002FC94BD0